MTETKSGRELEPEMGAKGSPTARRFYALFGLGVSEDDSDDDSSE